MSFVDSYIVFRVSVADLKRLKINMKIKIMCFKVIRWPKKSQHSTIKTCKIDKIYKIERSASPLMGIWICTTSDRTQQRDELFANFIQEAVLDSSACSSHSLLFRSNLFNYFSFCLIFGIDSFFESITNIMTGQYFLLDPFYIHSMNSIISAQKAYI